MYTLLSVAVHWFKASFIENKGWNCWVVEWMNLKKKYMRNIEINRIYKENGEKERISNNKKSFHFKYDFISLFHFG